MARLSFDECGTYTTPQGKKVIGLHMTPEFYARLTAVAKVKSMSRQAYILYAINMVLEQDEDRQRQIKEWGT